MNSWLCLISLLLPLTKAVNIPIHRRSPQSPTGSRFHVQNAAVSSTDVGLTSAQDMAYMGEVEIAGTQYLVQLDTGSSDLWIKPPATIPGLNETNLPVNISYASGWSAGVVATASVSFAGFTVPDQAFLYAEQSNNPVFSYNGTGVLGLGLTSLSYVQSTVNAAWGANLLVNIFAQNPSEPNFIAVTLQRTSDPADTVEGTLSIGEVDPQYSSVLSTPKIPTFPAANPTRWSVLMDSYNTINGTQSVTSTTAGAPAGKSVILMDSGTSYIYAPKAMVDSIYSDVPGAKFDTGSGTWTMPCDSQVYVAFNIGGARYDLHPLDVVDTITNSLSDGCLGTLIPLTFDINGFDILAGDAFLRNVATVYDFGDFIDNTQTMGNPYLQFLSTTNITAASIDFRAIRGGSGLIDIQPPTNAVNQTDTPASGPASTSTPVTLSSLQQKVDKLETLFPIAMALLGVNVLTLLGLCIVGVIFMRRKGRKRKGGKTRGSSIRSTNSTTSIPKITQGGSDVEYDAVPNQNLDDGEPQKRTPSYYSLEAPNPAFIALPPSRPGSILTRSSIAISAAEAGRSSPPPTHPSAGATAGAFADTAPPFNTDDSPRAPSYHSYARPNPAFLALPPSRPGSMVNRNSMAASSSASLSGPGTSPPPTPPSADATSGEFPETTPPTMRSERIQSQNYSRPQPAFLPLPPSRPGSMFNRNSMVAPNIGANGGMRSGSSPPRTPPSADASTLEFTEAPSQQDTDEVPNHYARPNPAFMALPTSRPGSMVSRNSTAVPNNGPSLGGRGSSPPRTPPSADSSATGFAEVASRPSDEPPYQYARPNPAFLALPPSPSGSAHSRSSIAIPSPSRPWVGLSSQSPNRTSMPVMGQIPRSTNAPSLHNYSPRKEE